MGLEGDEIDSERWGMLEFLFAGFVIPFVVSASLIPVLRRLAPKLGLIDQPGDRKVHIQPTPRSGGIAVWLGIVLAVLLQVLADRLQWTGPESLLQTLNAFLRDHPNHLKQMISIGIGACTLFFVGLADDRWNLSWYLRLGFQGLVAAGVVAAGVRATVFVAHPWFGIAVTVLWILILTNAMNFLDNMDALSAGIGVIASLILVVIMIVLVRVPAWPVAMALLLLAGSLSGFLVWNRPPASIFMGDCGSNLTGFLLATLTITGTFYEHTGHRHVILAPLCVLAIPLYDFCTVILIRLKQGRSPFHGDKSHFSHRLVELGLRPTAAVLTIHLATLMTGLAGILLFKVTDWIGAFVVLALILCVLAIVAILETVGRHSVNSIQSKAAGVQDSARPENSPVTEAASCS